MNKEIKTVAVHNGMFHADDVFAIAISRLIYPNIKVIRTRDHKELEKTDLRVDVGKKYNPDNGDFDHHQPKGAGGRENGIPYASVGLIWKHFGMKLAKSSEVFDYIDKKIIQYIDANDTGTDTFTTNLIAPYTIDRMISSFNPQWPNLSYNNYDRAFEEILLLVIELLKKEIVSVESVINSKEKVREAISKSDGNYIILNDNISWKEVVVNESHLKFVVYYDLVEDTWSVNCIPKSINSFENRKNLPKEWAGLSREQLVKVTGVKDATFCHNKRFVAFAKSKEGVLKLLNLALKNNSL